MLTLFSPAKINLFLKVISKRPDGYHDLASVFQTISLADQITIEQAEKNSLTSSDPKLRCDHTNLIIQALELFQKKTGSKNFFKIHLIKKIPIEAGLGGGSSNAATALWGCNHLTHSNIPLKDLQEWGAEIGSDVPFFFSQGTAFCTGRGEKVFNLPNSSAQSLWVVKPPEKLSTAKVFRNFNFDNAGIHNSPEVDLVKFCSEASPHFNDLELTAFSLEPSLKKLKDLLVDSGFKTVLMTGSGSAFFCLGNGVFPPDLNASIYPVHYLNRSITHWYQT